MTTRHSGRRVLGGVLALFLCIPLLAAGPLRGSQGADGRIAPTVRVRLVKAKESNAQKFVILIRVEGAEMVLGAYEGHVEFDPSVFVVDSATAGRDGSRFVNPADANKGRIRFAGFTPTGFSSTDAVRIVGRAVKPIEKAQLSATLNVAGDLHGKAVPRTGLIGATSIEAIP